MCSYLRKTLYKFDLYGEPVAPLNIKGKTTIHTSCGGTVGLMFTVLVLWFFGLNLRKLINKTDPNLYQTSEGLDLMAPDTPAFTLSLYNYSIGLGVYGVK